MYADLELIWVPIVDRNLVRADVAAGGAMKDCVLASKHQRIRSPLLLRDVERNWLLSQIPTWGARWMDDARDRAMRR
jgi:hypothetical protein